jgi:hypothetical protein
MGISLPHLVTTEKAWTGSLEFFHHSLNDVANDAPLRPLALFATAVCDFYFLMQTFFTLLRLLFLRVLHTRLGLGSSTK